MATMPHSPQSPLAPESLKSRNTLAGFDCPNCEGYRLHVITTKRAARFIIVRYRECVACRFRVKTEERPTPIRVKRGKQRKGKRP